MDSETLLSKIEAIAPPSRCSDWAAKLQELCESLWPSLAHDCIDCDVLDGFTQLLLDPDGFALARLVLPDLRVESDTATKSTQQQAVLDRIRHLRGQASSHFSPDQALFDTLIYREEKDLQTEAELYRLKLLLYRSAGPLSLEQENELKSWWDRRPGQKTTFATVSGSLIPGSLDKFSSLIIIDRPT